MYHFSGPQFGLMVALPSAIASANGPHAAALSLSKSDDLTANQLQNHVTQARRMREKLIDQVSKPPEPGWKSAVNQISETVDRMEKVLSFLQTQGTLHATPVEDMEALAVFPSGVAMQQSGRMSGAPPSEAESPTASSPGNATTMREPIATSVEVPALRSPQVLYVMDEGVIIVGLPPLEPPGSPQEAASPTSGADIAQGAFDAPNGQSASPRRQRLDTQEQVTANMRAEDWRQDTARQEDARRTGSASDPNNSGATILSVPLTEGQDRTSRDLIALAQKAYAQLQQVLEEQPGALSTDANVGITGNLSRDPLAPPTAENASVETRSRSFTSIPVSVHQPRDDKRNDDPLYAPSDPFAHSPERAAARAREDQRLMALQLDGTSDIIYIVPAAKASMDLIA